MNRFRVKNRVKQLGVVTLKADKTQKNPEIDKLMVELGNKGRVIPFYAIYPKNGGEPITLDGLITQQQILDALEKASGSN